MAPVFLQEPMEVLDGLQQVSTRQIHYPKDPHGPTIVSVQLTLLPYVLPTYWERHRLSLEDIKQTHADVIPPKFYWLAALLYGIDVIASSIRPSFRCMHEVLISQKPLAIEKMMKQKKVNFPTKSNLLSSSSHVPSPPQAHVTPEEMNLLSKMIYHDIKPFDVMDVPHLFPWQNGLFIATTLEQDGILIQRCVLYDNFIQSKKQQPHGYASRPLLIRVQGTLYAIVEECVLLSCTY